MNHKKSLLANNEWVDYNCDKENIASINAIEKSSFRKLHSMLLLDLSWLKATIPFTLNVP